MKLLVKKKNGTVHIREKSQEDFETLDNVHPNKVRTLLALSEASHGAFGHTMEEIIQAVIDETIGKTYRQPTKIEVTEADYIQLCKQAYKKGVTKKQLDLLVSVVAEEKEEMKQPIEEIITQFT